MRQEGRSSLPLRDTAISNDKFSKRAVIGLAGTLLTTLLILGGQAPAAAQAEATKGGGAVDGPTFIKLPPIVLPVFNDKNKITRQAGLVLALELEPGKTAADIEPNRRKLQDAFITDLYALYDQLGESERVIESALIKERLQATSDRVLGPGVVRAVLIQQAFERGRR